MAYSRLLLNDAESNLALVDDVSVLLLDAVNTVGVDTSPFRRFYRLDARADYRLDARRTYRSR